MSIGTSPTNLLRRYRYQWSGCPVDCDRRAVFLRRRPAGSPSLRSGFLSNSKNEAGYPIQFLGGMMLLWLCGDVDHPVDPKLVGDHAERVPPELFRMVTDKFGVHWMVNIAA